MTRILAAQVGDIAEGEAKAVPHDPPIALFHADGRYFATQEMCSHEEASIIDGWVGDDCTIECPWHNAKFCLKTGQPLTPPAYEPLRVYRVVVEGADIFIEL